MFSLTGYLDNIYNDVNSGYVAVLVYATNTISNEEPAVSRFCLVSSFILTTAKKKIIQLVTCSFFTKIIAGTMCLLCQTEREYTFGDQSRLMVIFYNVFKTCKKALYGCAVLPAPK